ncbi:MAG: metallophosphoesterase [Bacteroidales bacterium]|nr:metallophosphoesterase [Bacteroidales bacterium]
MRIAVISDIHEDIMNLRKTLDQIFQLDTDKIICLGDIVGFENKHYKFRETKSAQKCVHLLKEHSDIVTAGNHDLAATERLPCFMKKIGFPEKWNTISMDEKEKTYKNKFFLYKDETENDLNESDKEFIKNLPSWKILETDAMNMLISHFIYPDINGNLTTFNTGKKSFYKHFEWMEKLDVNISFVGHTHIEGVGIVRKNSFKTHDFGIYSLKAEPQIILCPSIAKGKFKNGFVLFDSNNMKLEVISL